MDQRFARFACDHRLEFAGGKSVDVARFTGHKQQHLGSRQGGQFICLQETEDRFSVGQKGRLETGPRVSQSNLYQTGNRSDSRGEKGKS